MDEFYSTLKSPKTKFDVIQFFRFIAALMVIIFHSIVYTSERLKPGFMRYDQGGFDGVSLFFVISGFVMIISSENLVKRITGWKIFAIKRIIRIVPIYWIVTTYKVLTMIFASSLMVNINMSDDFIIKSYFFIPAKNSHDLFFPFYNVGWTLNFEMFFYMCFTIALALRANIISFFCIIFIPLSILSIYKTPQWSDISFYFNPIVLNFLFGMIAAKLVLKQIKMPQMLALPIIALSLIYLFVPKAGIIPNFLPNYVPAFLVVYGGASIESKWGPKIPAWFIFLGEASYSLYLIHPIVAPLAPIILKLLKLQWAWCSVVIGVVISITVGIVFYKFCETPLTQFFTKKARKHKLI